MSDTMRAMLGKINELETENQQLKEQVEAVRYYNLGCQGELDLIPIIMKAQRAESAEAEVKTLKAKADKWDEITDPNKLWAVTGDFGASMIRELKFREAKDRLVKAQELLDSWIRQNKEDMARGYDEDALQRIPFIGELKKALGGSST